MNLKKFKDQINTARQRLPKPEVEHEVKVESVRDFFKDLMERYLELRSKFEALKPVSKNELVDLKHEIATLDWQVFDRASLQNKEFQTYRNLFTDNRIGMNELEESAKKLVFINALQVDVSLLKDQAIVKYNYLDS